MRGIFVELLREGPREGRRLHFIKIDYAPLGLRDDLLCHYKYISALEFQLLRLHCLEYKKPQVAAWGNLANSLYGHDTYLAVHVISFADIGIIRSACHNVQYCI